MRADITITDAVSIKHQLGIKRGLEAECKMWTAD